MQLGTSMIAYRAESQQNCKIHSYANKMTANEVTVDQSYCLQSAGDRETYLQVGD